MEKFFKEINDTFALELIITLAVLFAMTIIRAIARKIVYNHIKKYDLEPGRRYLINKFINLTVFITTITLIAIVWDVTFKGLAVYFTSFFAVAGIGLFAQWSILSNITAAVILFFNYPFKIGSKISILEKDMIITGIITDITLFTIQIKTDKNDSISYPNNLALQKPIQIVKT